MTSTPLRAPTSYSAAVALIVLMSACGSKPDSAATSTPTSEVPQVEYYVGTGGTQCVENGFSQGTPVDPATGATIVEALDAFENGSFLFKNFAEYSSAESEILTESDLYTHVVYRRSDQSVLMSLEMSRGRDLWRVNQFTSC